MNVQEIDDIVHHFIHQLLLKAEDNQDLVHQVHLKESMVHHQDLIISIKDQIKPGLFKSYTQKFTPDMLKDYFNKLQHETIQSSMAKIREKI